MVVSWQQDAVKVVVLTERGRLGETVKRALDHGAYITRVATEAGAAWGILKGWNPELAIVDIDHGGDRLLNQIASSSPNLPRSIPILALTRSQDLKTKLSAFERGVDDVMTIPLAVDELLARIGVIARRNRPPDGPLRPILKVGEIEFDVLRRHVRSQTSELRLTSLEWSLLYVLTARAGQVATRDEIADALWGVDFDAESNVVDQHVRNVRAKLQSHAPHLGIIATVPGRGYRFLPTFSDVTVRSVSS